MFSQMFANPQTNPPKPTNPKKSLSFFPPKALRSKHSPKRLTKKKKKKPNINLRMDQIKAEKIRAMKYSCYKKSQIVLYNLIFSSLVALTCSVLCSYPFWFSSLTSSTKHFLFISLPNTWSSFLNPKCLFVVFNVIVAFLVGESKLLGSHQSSPANDIYSEYVERTRSLRRQKKHLIHEEKREEKKLEADVNMIINEESHVVVNKVFEDKEIVLVEHKEEKLVEEEDDHGEFKEADQNNIDDHEEIKGGEDDHSDGLPAEELNRKVEEFIARINKQRWLEARMLICGQA